MWSRLGWGIGSFENPRAYWTSVLYWSLAGSDPFYMVVLSGGPIFRGLPGHKKSLALQLQDSAGMSSRRVWGTATPAARKARVARAVISERSAY